MRITLVGYGKTGRIIEKVAREQKHDIVHIVNSKNPLDCSDSRMDWASKSDVVIDFSISTAVVNNVEMAFQVGIPIVIGTTGWNEDLEKIRKLTDSKRGACVYASNFSLGVQMLFRLTAEVGKLLSRFGDFHPFILESHHEEKVDEPSGTALSLHKILQKSSDLDAVISSVRAGFFPGTHLVGLDSPFETLVLEHTARNREGFARGALLAAEWIREKKGFYNFEEILFGGEK